MAQLPSSIVLQELRKLQGGARVTYPGTDLDVIKVERVVKMPRNAWSIAFYTPDTEHPTAELTNQQKVGEDQQWAEVYREYQTLPGVMLTGVETDAETNEQVSTTRQIVKKGSVLPANTPGIIWEMQPFDDVISIKVSRDITNLLNKIFTSYPEISYTFPGLLTVRGGSLSEDRQPSSSRSRFSDTVRARVELSFTQAAEDRTGEIFKYRSINVRSDAGTFNEVLHNLKTATIGGRKVAVEESFPTSTDYPTGSEVLIGAPSILSTNGLYRNTATFITLL